MKPTEDIELLELLFVELDPLQDGFAGVLLEVYRRGDRYVLLEMAPTTGNRLLAFSSKHRELVYTAFAREIDRLHR
jgi:sporulation-control protein spo0M